MLGTDDLDRTSAFFIELGFRLDAIFPADDPAVLRLSGHGVEIELRRGLTGGGRLRVSSSEFWQERELVAPNGTVLELVPEERGYVLPEVVRELSIERAPRGEVPWSIGRAGMRYRDLLPKRLGGRFIASQIQIPESGLVPDYVHYHEVRFQMIFVAEGWVRLVYEDQGEPFILRAGDSVLQPPEIRHRVLESGDGLEVIEISCPTSQVTRVEHDIELPTRSFRPERRFGGQRFVRQRAESAPFRPWGKEDGWLCRDLGIADGTGGLASAEVVRGARNAVDCVHDGELWFAFVWRGTLELVVQGRREELGPGDAFSIPARMPFQLAAAAESEMLVVKLPAG